MSTCAVKLTGFFNDHLTDLKAVSVPFTVHAVFVFSSLIALVLNILVRGIAVYF